MLTDKDFDLLYQSMCHDSYFPPSRPAFDRLLEGAEQLFYKAKKCVVEYGTVDSDIWIVGKGVARLVYYNETQEMTYGFGGQGTLFCSPLGLVKGDVANFHLIAVTDCIMFRLPKKYFLNLVTTEIELSNWFSGAMLYQIMAAEARINSHNYPAAERVERFMKGMTEQDYNEINPHMRFNRHKLPMRVLASYFGITRSHMAHIIKKMYEKDSGNASPPPRMKIKYMVFNILIIGKEAA